MFALNFRQTGDAFELPEDLATFSPGPVSVKGALYPSALIGSGNTDTANAIPLNVDGNINIGTQKYRGEVELKHEGKRFLDILAEYDTKDRFGGLTVKSLPAPQAVVDASPNPYLFPEYDSAELKITMRPGKEDSWMVYTTGIFNQFRDRGGRTRTGNAKLESHCEFIEDKDGQWSASSFPVQLRWNDDVVFKCLANASTDLSSLFSFRFNDGSTPLPILFNVANPNTLSPGLTCSGGTLQTTGNFTIKEGTWVANSRMLIKDAAFEPMANFKRKTTSFDWDFMINSKGILGISSDLKLTSKGPGWSNEAKLDITWDSKLSKIAFLKVQSEGADFTPFWEIFRRNRPYPSQTRTRPFNIYDSLPPDIVLRSMICKYKFDLKKVEFGPLQIDRMKVHLNASEGRLAIVDCELELNDAPIWATGFLETTELGSNLEFKLNASKIPLRPIMSVIYDGAPADDVRGELTFEADIKSKGNSLSDAISSATGNGKLLVDGFRFYKDDELVDTARNASIDDLEYLEFETISSDLDFQDGKMITSNFKMERDELVQTMKIAIDAKGKITVSDIEHRITLSHYDKYFAGKVSGFFGFGPSSKGSPGYKVFNAPVNLVRDASGWGVEVLDDNLFKPFKESAFGKWFIPSKPSGEKN